MFCLFCLFSCKKNEYLNASVDETTVEFTTTAISETISFNAGNVYDILVPIQVFGGTSDATVTIVSKTSLPSDVVIIPTTKKINGTTLDTITLQVKTEKLKKGQVYTLELTLSSSEVAISKNYESCAVSFSQQAFMDFFTGVYSCYESATGSIYEVEFTKDNDTTVKNNNFYDFPLAGQMVPYVFSQGESHAVEISEDYAWTDKLGNKYLVSGKGTYDSDGNFTVDYVMKDASTEAVYQQGTHMFRKK